MKSSISNRNYPFRSTGFIKTLPGWWMLLTVDPNIAKYYAWLTTVWGKQVEWGHRNGPHISVVKGEIPKNKKRWDQLKSKSFEFNYSVELQDNGYHIWLPVQSRDLSKLRQSLGLKEKPYHSFHLTIGRLRHNIDHKSHEPRVKKKKINF